MANNGTLLPIPFDSELRVQVAFLTAAWPAEYAQFGAPRAAWLTAMEDLLAWAHPNASSADRKLTARSLAPFPLVLPGEP